MRAEEAIEHLRKEQKTIIRSIEVYNNDHLDLTDAMKETLIKADKKTIEAIDMAIEALGGKENEV